MKILALETSAAACSAALCQDGTLLAQSWQNSGLTHSRTLLPLVDSMLKNCGASLKEVEVIAVAAGPGSFTGVLTLAVLTLPVIINTTEEALRQVPDAWREASLALGATRSQTIARVVLPAAVPGMLTGAILGLARAAGETAAIMFTAAVFYTPKMPDSVFSAVMSLPYHMYVLATAGTEIEKTRPLQYGTALILLVLVLGMNLIAIIIRDRMQRKR